MIASGIHNGEEVTVLRTHDDLITLLEEQKDCVTEDYSYLITHAIPPDRWDHYTSKTLRSIFSAGIFKMMYGANSEPPITALTTGLNMFAKRLFNAWDKLPDGYALVINKNGGYHTAPVDEIQSIRQREKIEPDRVVIHPKTNTIILENDPELPKWTQQHVPREFSYIVRLRELSADELRAALKKFARGKKQPDVFVYTTGMDVVQMKMYVDQIALAGITRLEWATNDATAEPFPQMIVYAKDKGIIAAAYDTDDERYSVALRNNLSQLK